MSIRVAVTDAGQWLQWTALASILHHPNQKVPATMESSAILVILRPVHCEVTRMRRLRPSLYVLQSG